MAKDTQVYPVSKGDSKKFFGYADAGQIARSKGKLSLFDADVAAKLEVQSKIEAEQAAIDGASEKANTAKKAGGADASAVKKAPAGK